MGIRETEHEFVVISPDGRIHKFQMMLALVDEDGFDFYDENDRNNVTTCSCGQTHPFNIISKLIDFGPIKNSEHPFHVNLDYLASIIHMRRFNFRQKNCPPIILTVQYYEDVQNVHEISYDIIDFTEGTRLVYIEINGPQVLACANHPFFTREYYEKYHRTHQYS